MMLRIGNDKSMVVFLLYSMSVRRVNVSAQELCRFI